MTPDPTTQTIRDLALVAVFAGIVAALGLFPAVSAFGGAVPITAQSLGIMLAGAILGPRRGALALVRVPGLGRDSAFRCSPAVAAVSASSPVRRSAIWSASPLPPSPWARITYAVGAPTASPGASSPPGRWRGGPQRPGASSACGSGPISAWPRRPRPRWSSSRATASRPSSARLVARGVHAADPGAAPRAPERRRAARRRCLRLTSSTSSRAPIRSLSFADARPRTRSARVQHVRDRRARRERSCERPLVGGLVPHVSDLLGLDPASRVWMPGPLTRDDEPVRRAHAAWAGAASRVDRDGRHARPPDPVGAAARSSPRTARPGRAARRDRR